MLEPASEVTGMRIFTAPPGVAFLEALARAILTGQLPVPSRAPPDSLSLPDYTVLLPTRRSARALQEAFLVAGGGNAILLPVIRPIAEGQEDLGLLETADVHALAAGADLPPAIGELERKLVLTRFVLAWSQSHVNAGTTTVDVTRLFAGRVPSPAQAVKLASDLAALMDAVETEGVSLAGLKDIVPETFSEHWQRTIAFLKIVTETFPAYLAQSEAISPVQRRNRLVLAEAARLAARPPAGPVIVAGVTGSIPATTELMRAVIGLDTGAVVLPALDRALDDETWHELADTDPGHPQYGLRLLLERLGVQREAVAILPGSEISGTRVLRNVVVAEAMRPSRSMVRWQSFVADANRTSVTEALAGISLIEAPNAHDEAEIVALVLREALETPGRTAALVSPDRLLARRVAATLERWGIRVDDSAGRPFAKTVPGAFLDLVADAVSVDFAPAELMALLGHPLTRLGLPAGQMRRAARALEIAVFRTMYLGSGIAGIDAALERAAREARSGARRQRTARRLWDADWAAARDLVQRLAAAVAPLADLFAKREKLSLADLATAHIKTAEALARPAEDGESIPIWYGEAGEAAARLFAGLMEESVLAPALDPADYPDFYRALIAGENVRPRVPVHPRLSIWGPFEARLQQADVVVLGSLNEGIWPAAADPGAWLNRPMRSALGLPVPEEEIGRAAHDFTCLMGADRVILTRAGKIDGVPTVASRWLLRLQALLQGLGLTDCLDSPEPWLAWARARDRISERRHISAPEPRPAVVLRPRRASVSDVETWIANPYAVFARRVLKLEPLPSLGAEPGPAEKGQIVHEALSRFAARHPEVLPADICAELLIDAQIVLDAFAAHPRAAAFWQPRLARFAAWFAETEPERRRHVLRLVTEVAGRRVLDAPGGPFTLSARADRIDVLARAVIISDYKTGALPKPKDLSSGQAPQLPLEAAIMACGGFDHLEAMPVAALRFIRATGGEPPGEEITIPAGDHCAVAANALLGLQKLIAHFDDAATPFRATRRARFRYDYDDYAHLARVAEWSSVAPEEGET